MRHKAAEQSGQAHSVTVYLNVMMSQSVMESQEEDCVAAASGRIPQRVLYPITASDVRQKHFLDRDLLQCTCLRAYQAVRHLSDDVGGRPVWAWTLCDG